MPLLLATADAAALRLPRAAVRAHAATERRRTLRAAGPRRGSPGSATLTVAAHPATTDHALRCDMVAAMLARHRRDGTWCG